VHSIWNLSSSGLHECKSNGVFIFGRGMHMFSGGFEKNPGRGQKFCRRVALARICHPLKFVGGV